MGTAELKVFRPTGRAT